MRDAVNSILGVMNILLSCLSGGAVYVIFDSFVNVSDDAEDAKQYMEQLSVLISVFYILIVITSFYSGILFFNSVADGDPHHVLILILNSFLFFYGFISLIPAAISLVNGATKSVYAPIATSILSIVIGAAIVIYYTWKGSKLYLRQDNFHHLNDKNDLQNHLKQKNV